MSSPEAHLAAAPHGAKPTTPVPTNPDIVLGVVVRINAPPGHMAVVISDPTVTGGVVLVVRLTELREKWDDCCTLIASDYSELHKTTVPAYRTAYKGTSAQMQKAIDDGHMSVVSNPLPAAALEKILKGAMETDELPTSMRTFVAKR